MNNDLIKTFFEIVKIDSPSGNEDAISKYIVNTLTKVGYKCKRDEYGNITLSTSGIGLPLLLSAHLDTVEPGRNIEPIIENGIIRSKGKTILGADNKVAVAVFLQILKDLKTKNIPHRPLDIVFTVFEETTSLGVSKLNYSDISAREGYIFDNANPVGTIITASPFYYRFDILIKGKFAHSSKVEEGVNVLLILKDALKKVKLGKVSKKTRVNIGVINSGYVRNSIPGEMKLLGEVRSFSNTEAKKYLKKLEEAFALSAKKHGGKIGLVFVIENYGYEYSKKNKFLKDTIETIKKINLEPLIKTSFGCSDANVFNKKGIHVLDLGDGTMDAHTTEEKISVGSLLKLKDLVFELIV